LVFAHSRQGHPTAEWEPLSVHLQEVAARACSFASAFGFGAAGDIVGRLHDIGKASQAYQAYIAASAVNGAKGPDHSTAGAREAEALFGPSIGRLFAYAIAGHHAGLADFSELKRRLREKTLERYDGWRDHVGALFEKPAFAPPPDFKLNLRRGFGAAFLTRMLFSCLVDADFLATEQFYGGAEREAFASLDLLQGRLDDFLIRKQRTDTELNRLRAEVLVHAVGKANLAPGMFTLTVPTGGGKTLTSLAFALAHARKHSLRRVIYVIPYTSIIEQTAAVFREALGGEHDVLEHHASFDWEPNASTEEADDEGQAGLKKLQKAAENWAAPVVATTAVQFFESLYARRPSQCRKLHNIAGSVVVLDEAQTLPLRLLRPCMAALDELAANYRTSIVLCTATQPALRECDGFKDQDLKPKQPRQKIGFAIDDSRELAPNPLGLYSRLKRVGITQRGKTTDAEIAARFAGQPQMLCIVNNRRHARELFDLLKSDPKTSEGAMHLTTLMCPVHRRQVLEAVRARLARQEPVRLVATSLIEAGVDVDFPEVWRAITGIDSIAQAAGRCNREDKQRLGRVVVFEPAEGKPPSDLKPLISAAEGLFRRGLDPLSLDGVRAYFQEVYWQRSADAMDAAMLDGQPWPILRAISETFDSMTGEATFDFELISRAFRMIDSPQETVIVPLNDDARDTLDRLAAAERPARNDLRKLQQFAVSIPKRDRDAWLAAGVLSPVHARIGDALLAFGDLSHYRSETGIDLNHPDQRDAWSNLL
jgi:CRISPR-associated endonuclease/helicase Cas3